MGPRVEVPGIQVAFKSTWAYPWAAMMGEPRVALGSHTGLPLGVPGRARVSPSGWSNSSRSRNSILGSRNSTLGSCNSHSPPWRSTPQPSRRSRGGDPSFEHAFHTSEIH